MTTMKNTKHLIERRGLMTGPRGGGLAWRWMGAVGLAYGLLTAGTLMASEETPKPAAAAQADTRFAIDEIKLYENRSANADQQAIEKLSRYSPITIQINSGALTDAILPHILNQPNLRELVIFNCGLSEKGIEQLLAIKSLKSVSVDDFYIKPELLEKFASEIKPGQKLSLRLNKTTPERLSRIVQSREIESLTLIGSQMTDEHLETLAQARGVRRLKLQCASNFTFEGLAALKIKNLQEFEPYAASASQKHPTAVGAFMSNHSLKAIHASYVGSLDFLKDQKGVTELSIGNAYNLDSENWKIIQSMSDIQTLTLARAKISPQDLKQLLSLPKLRTLHISNSGVGEKDLQELAKEFPSVLINPEINMTPK